MNLHDSEIYAGQLRKLGYRPAVDPSAADIILLNTCSVRQKAEEKLFSELGRLRHLKKDGREVPGGRHAAEALRPDVKIGVTGCIAQQRGAEILDREGCVDFVLGTRALRALPGVLESLDAGAGPQVMTEDHIDFDAGDAWREDRVKAFVTIMEGCNNYCSFCIVPTTRGLEIYRRAADIIDEVRGLDLRGYREVTLLGQNVNSWLDPETGTGFPELLSRLNRAVSTMKSGGMERIRFLTSHPKDLSPSLIEAMADGEHLAKHLHLPVQSGSDRVLWQMNRNYSSAAYLDIVESLRRSVPDVGLSTDLIVGFPGENDEDFEATLELVRNVQYDSFYSFEYSPRPGTAATRYEDTVPPEVKRERLIVLQQTQRDIQVRKNAVLRGQTLEVLVDGFSRRSESDVSGRTSSNHIVNLPGNSELIGRLVDVRITDSGPHSLYGEALSTAR